MIPKMIHYCWFGRNPKPKSVEKCIKSWKKYCPDYQIIEWNEDNYDVTKIPYMKAAYEAKKWGFATDYARLDIIYNHGGIYVDTDVELLKSYDSLLEYAGFAGFETEKYVASGLGIGAEKGNLIIQKLLENYEALDPVQKDGSLKFLTCPRVDTDVLVELGLKKDGTMQMIGGNFCVLPTEYLCPKDFGDGLIRKTKNTISIHHYDSSWFSEARQEEKYKRWRAGRKEYVRYLPHRILMKIIGKQHYEVLKRKFQRTVDNR